MAIQVALRSALGLCRVPFLLPSAPQPAASHPLSTAVRVVRLTKELEALFPFLMSSARPEGLDGVSHFFSLNFLICTIKSALVSSSPLLWLHFRALQDGCKPPGAKLLR